MKLAFVSREYPPSKRAGGIATYVWESARNLTRRGHKVFVVAASDDVAQSSSYEDNGVHVIRLPGGDFYLGSGMSLGGSIHSYGRKLQRHLAYRRQVAKTLLQLHEEYVLDLVEFAEYGNEAREWSRERRPVPWVVRLHGPTMLNRLSGCKISPLSSPISWLFSRGELITAQRADAISAPSTCMADKVRSFVKKTLPEIEIIPNGIDPVEWRSIETVAPVDSLDGRVIRLFSAGSIVEGKGYRELVEAVRILQEKGYRVSLALAGKHGALGRELQRGIERGKYGAWLELLGPLERRQLRSRYAEADLCVFPSWWEPFGLVCIEAMSTGALVLGSSQGGMAEIIFEGVDGFLVAPRDVNALADKIGAILSLPDYVRLGIRKNSIAKVREVFSVEVLLPRQEEFYRSVIGQGRR